MVMEIRDIPRMRAEILTGTHGPCHCELYKGERGAKNRVGRKRRENREHARKTKGFIDEVCAAQRRGLIAIGYNGTGAVVVRKAREDVPRPIWFTVGDESRQGQTTVLRQG